MKLLPLLLLFACSGTPEVDPVEIHPLLTIVVDRHDEFVKADPALDEIAKQALLSESVLHKQQGFSPLVVALLDRHDAYVSKLPLQERIDPERQSAILRMAMK